MMAVPVETDASLTPGTPELLFQADYFFGYGGRAYDIALDGRFLMIKSEAATEGNAEEPEITVVLNWHQELLERVPLN